MCSTFFRKLFRRGNSHSTDFHPDRPPPGPYLGPNPYEPTSFSPPSGPPPGFVDKQSSSSTSYPPPPKLPPSFPPLSDSPPPDLPPAFHALYLSSPTSNASSTLADAGWDFTDANPLSAPTHFTPSTLSLIHSGTLGFAPPPPRFLGTINSSSPGILNISSSPGCPDTCLISSLPLYAAGYDHPYNTGHSASAYFTVHITSLPVDSCLAVGFCAVPYPGFRLPGWNRGSLGIHGDDGRRYVNDSFGGRDFVVPFKAGETVGVGMKWAREGVEVWFTRNGVREGGWRLDEQRDAREENDPAPGLDGGCDVYGAVGVWGGGVKAQVRFLKEGEEGK